jgi:hypothetical protein
LGNPKIDTAAKEFCDKLSGKPPSTSGDSGITDRTVFHRTLIVTVRKEPPFNPADRLEATDVTVFTPEARFDNWDSLATTYSTINAGTVQLTEARGLTEGLTLGTPTVAPLTASATAGGSQTDTRVENYTATQQAETLTATIDCNGHCLRIRRQGGNGVDLTGNTVIKADMTLCSPTDGGECSAPERIQEFSVEKYKDKKGKWLSPQAIKLMENSFAVAPPKYAESGIKAKVTLSYTLRHVVYGDSTYEEKDDDIEELTRSGDVKYVTLVPGRDVSPPEFGLVETSRGFERLALNLDRPGRNPVGACFQTYDEASDFLSYLRVVRSKIKNGNLGDARIGFVSPPNGFVPLTPQDILGLKAEPRCL